MHGDQSGEVSVLLRCALLAETEVSVYAGAGLVADSDVDMEWQETELKMNAILDLFQG
jgi:isochorismate synthase EntC